MKEARAWGGWALDRDTARLLARTLDRRQPKLAVEAGSGMSTDLLTLYCDEVLTLEHDPQYAHPHATLCELVDGWYDIELPDEIDFVLLDGPPMSEGREEGLPRLWPHLADNFELWMDDADRTHEEEAVTDWLARFDIWVEYVPTSKGLFIIRRLP